MSQLLEDTGNFSLLILKDKSGGWNINSMFATGASLNKEDVKFLTKLLFQQEKRYSLKNVRQIHCGRYFHRVLFTDGSAVFFGDN